MRQGLRQTHFWVPNPKFGFRIICVFIHFRHATQKFWVGTQTWFATRSTPNPLWVPVPRLAIKILKGHNPKTQIAFSVHLVTNQALEGTDARPAANRPTLPHKETLYRGPVAKRGVPRPPPRPADRPPASPRGLAGGRAGCPPLISLLGTPRGRGVGGKKLSAYKARAWGIGIREFPFWEPRSPPPSRGQKALGF